MPDRLGGQKDHQAQSEYPAKQNYDLQHRGVSEINASFLSLRGNVAPSTTEFPAYRYRPDTKRVNATISTRCVHKPTQMRVKPLKGFQRELQTNSTRKASNKLAA